MNVSINTNYLKDMLHAAKTIDNDPGNHKKKALISGIPSIGATAYVSGKLLKNSLHNFSQNPTRAITGTAVPLGLIYAYNNKDNIKKKMLGIGTAATGFGANFAYHMHHIKNQLAQNPETVYQPQTKQLAKSIGLIAAPVAGLLYSNNELSKMREAEHAEKRGLLDYMQNPNISILNKINTLSLIKKKGN